MWEGDKRKPQQAAMAAGRQIDAVRVGLGDDDRPTTDRQTVIPQRMQHTGSSSVPPA